MGRTLKLFYGGLGASNPCATGADASPTLSLEIISWPSTVSRSAWPGLVVTFRITGPRWVDGVEIDLIGDGVPGFAFDFGVNTDARNVGQVGYIPERTGTFSLIATAWDSAGCRVTVDAPLRRVTVTP